MGPPVYGVQRQYEELGKATSCYERFHDADKGVNDAHWALKVHELQGTTNAYLVQGHSILDKESNATVEVANIALEDKVLLRLGRDLALQFA